ncbi:hypothetical protein MMC21_008261 [Puttea exsequens]|nr:hypothetical protein [Puttea exsequens]
MVLSDEALDAPTSGTTSNERLDDYDRQLLRVDFQKATYAQDITRMKEIIDMRILTPDVLGFALSQAVGHGRLDIIKLLLDHSAPITMSANAIASRDDVPNTLDILKLFLRYGWSVESTATPSGKMAMNLMMQRQDCEAIVRWFLDHGAPVNGIASDPYAPIRTAAAAAPNISVVHLLLSHGADLRGTAALHGAVFRQFPDTDGLTLDIMNLLLDAGVDINELGYEGADEGSYEAWGADKGTALHVAAAEGFLTRAKLLVERGADVGKGSEMGYTAKDWAQLMWREDIKAFLEGVMRESGLSVKDCKVPEHWRGPPSGLVRRPCR